MRFLRLLSCALVTALAVRAADPLNPPIPFATQPAESTGERVLTMLAAQQAQRMGIPTVAEALYRQLLSVPGTDRQALTLELASALLDEGRPDEASRELFSLPTGHNSDWHLREALAQADMRNLNLAAHELIPIKPSDLSAEDRPWYWFVQGRLAAAGGDAERAKNLYEQAGKEAGSDLVRARLFLAQQQQGMLMGQVTEAGARAILQSAAGLKGTAVGYDLERTYAVMLNALGRRADAVAALRADLLALPAAERIWTDDFRLLIGLIAGAAEGEGRAALLQLLESGSDPVRQRVALQLLGNASVREPARDQFRTELDKLLSGPPSVLAAELYLFRAEWALRQPDYAAATEAAQAMLDRFPGSPLKGYALAVLTAASWDKDRFRTAADFARQARETFGPGKGRSRLGLLVAEALFRAGDYRGAADAYAAVLTEPPEGVALGDVMFQRVESEIRAGALERAQTTLDDAERNPGFETNDRWQAEWNLVRALQLHGDVATAYGRVNRLLGSASSPAAELRARMAWLQAQVAFDAGEFSRTLQLSDALVPAVNGLAEPLRSEIAGTVQLLRAQTYFALGRDQDARAALTRLREEAPGSQAAIKSYIVDADHYAEHYQIVEARQQLRKLADEFPKSPYAPDALYRSADLAERLGEPADFQDANKLLDELETKYPNSDLVFDAYLKDGDVLRELNRFDLAQRVYDNLVNRYPDNPNIILAELALAKCHLAQAPNDPGHAEHARSLFEELLARSNAPVDVRVEAGYHLGEIWVNLGLPDAAYLSWYRDVIQAFLLDRQRATELGASGRWWMTRTLLGLGKLLRDQGKFDQAQKMWRLILEKQLPGAPLAQANLDAAGAGPVKP